jgi:hypothetical protein
MGPQSCVDRAHRFVAGTAVTVALVLVASCGGSGNSSSTANTTNVTTGGSGTTTPGSSDPSAQIKSLSSAVESGQRATFKAEYKTSGAEGAETVVIEQKLPKTFFSSAGGTIINNGSATYYCTGSGGRAQCASQSGANPITSLASIFSPAAAISAMQQAQAQLAAHLAGYSVTFTDQSFAGLAATCVNISAQGQTAKYCVAQNGILTYSGTSTSSFELTSYTTNMSDSDFSLPAGATVVTAP